MSETESGGIEHVRDEVLEDAAFEIRMRADFIGWTDEEREKQYNAVADYLLDQRSDDRATEQEESR